MKRLVCLFLIILFCFAAKAQTIGVHANVNVNCNNVPSLITDGINGGVYYNAPIYKRLEYNVGINLINVTGIFYPFGGWDPPKYNSARSKTGILEVPLEIVLGLYRKNSEAKCKGYFHAGYAIGTNVYSQYTYLDRDENVIDRNTNTDYFANTLYQTIRIELEIRWPIMQKHTISLYMSGRCLHTNYEIGYSRWTPYLGAGLRLGFIVPKKAS
jgi:hypothetical protein